MQRQALIEALFENMQQMHRTGASKFHALIGQRDISLSQMELLVIVKHQQPISAKAIASSMRLTPGAVTQLVEQLVAKGLLERHEDERDRRITNISLSAGGTAKLRELQERRLRIMRKVVDSLDTEELAVMLRVQEKMLQHMEAEVAKAENKETK